MKKISGIIANPVARNSAIMFVGTMATNFGAYLYHVVVGRIMGPEKYSEIAALFSLLFLLSVPANVIQVVLTKYFSVYKASHDVGAARTLFMKSLTYIVVASIVGLLIYLPLIPLLQNLLHIKDFGVFLSLYAIVVSTFIMTSCTGLLIGFQKFLAFSGFSTIMIFLRLLSGFLLASFGVALTLFGNVVSNIIGIILFLLPIQFVFKKAPDKITIHRKEVLAYVIPTFLAILGLTIFYNIDVVLVKHFFEPAQAGIYASLAIFGKIIFFASSPLTMVLFPMIVERKTAKINHASLFWMGFWGVAGVSIALVIGYAAFSQFVAKILFGERFLAAAPYLGSFGIFMAFVTLSNYLLTVCLAVNKTKVGIIVLGGSLIQIVGMALFHSSISQVIMVNTVVTAFLTCLLLVYYRYEPRHS